MSWKIMIMRTPFLRLMGKRDPGLVGDSLALGQVGIILHFFNTEKSSVSCMIFHMMPRKSYLSHNQLLIQQCGNNIIKHRISEDAGKETMLGCSSWWSSISSFFCHSIFLCTGQGVSLWLIIHRVVWRQDEGTGYLIIRPPFFSTISHLQWS